MESPTKSLSSWFFFNSAVKNVYVQEWKTIKCFFYSKNFFLRSGMSFIKDDSGMHCQNAFRIIFACLFY